MLPDGTRPATIHIRDGRIARIGGYDDGATDSTGIDAESLVVLPGLVDTHVHINEPGRTEWEGFASATRAAAAGGVTTLVDMPLNSRPSTVSAEAFEAKRQAAEGQLHVDVGFWGGVVPGNAMAIRPLADRGVLGFKSFLAPSGVEEFPHVVEEDLRAALPVLETTGLPLLVHAELPSFLRDPIPAGNPRQLSNLARNPTGGERSGGDRPDDPARARVGRTNSCRAPLDGRSTGGHSARPRERRRDLLRDVSALPDLRRRTNC